MIDDSWRILSAFQALPTIVAVLIHHDFTFVPFKSVDRTPDRSSYGSRRRFHQYLSLLPSIVLILFPPHSTASLLRPLTQFTQQWPMLLSKETTKALPSWVTGRSGPFGEGCGKFCELIIAILLLMVDDAIRMPASSSPPPSNDPTNSMRFWWSFCSMKATQRLRWPSALSLGPMPGVHAFAVVIIVSSFTNVILSIWSRKSRQHGLQKNFGGSGTRRVGKTAHDGVNAMVHSTLGRRLSCTEHIKLAFMAVGNALCEEGVSRGFFLHELSSRAKLSFFWANLCQAMAFGLWHYGGIPSGWVGVFLTFLYGLVMGFLAKWGDGLTLPLLAHSIADYFIFSVVARKS